MVGNQQSTIKQRKAEYRKEGKASRTTDSQCIWKIEKYTW